MTCSDWFYFGLAGPFRFQWVAKYKELIAGIAAAAAATLVVIAAKIQVEATERGRLSAERNEINATLRVLAQAMRAVAISYASNVSRELIAKLVEANQPPNSFRITFPVFMVNYQMHAMNIDFLSEEIKSNDSKRRAKIEKLTAINMIKSRIFSEILENIYKTGIFNDIDVESKLIPSKSLCEDVRRTKVIAKDVGHLWGRFDWPSDIHESKHSAPTSRSHGNPSTPLDGADVSQPGM